MKKILSYLFIFIGIGLILLSSTSSSMKAISDKRIPLVGPFGAHHSTGAGDLVTMAYLDDEKNFYEPYSYTFTRPKDSGDKNINLYVWGDSYVLHVPDSAFGPINSYHFGRRDYSDLEYKLDAHKKNILIIANGERFIRGYFRNLSIFDHVRKSPASVVFPPITLKNSARKASFFDISSFDLFNTAINQNMEFNLFNYNFINSIRLLKARSVYKWFDRASGDVALSENGKYLFLKQTIAPHDLLSCYEPVGQPDLEQIMNNMDSIYEHYKKDGFDEVYFSMIPNPASILQPRYYNGLIPYIQKQAAVKGIPLIDVYTPFIRNPNPAGLYRLGDTHWNNQGLQIWIQAVNGELRRQNILK